MSDKALCRDRIDGQLSDREFYLQQVFEAIDSCEPFDGYDDANEHIYDFALGFQVKTMLTIELSTGGPADYLEVVIDKSSGYPEIDKMTYHFSDWFDHAEIKVSSSSPFYRYVETILDGIL